MSKEKLWGETFCIITYHNIITESKMFSFFPFHVIYSALHQNFIDNRAIEI